MLKFIWERFNERMVECTILISITILLYEDILILERIKIFFFNINNNMGYS